LQEKERGSENDNAHNSDCANEDEHRAKKLAPRDPDVSNPMVLPQLRSSDLLAYMIPTCCQLPRQYRATPQLRAALLRP
jgi:hypothetical protein